MHLIVLLATFLAPAPDPVSPARLQALSAPYLGLPYRRDCLGEGSGPDRDPLFTRRCVDCQTFVEQVMAEAAAPAVGGLDRAIRLVRYRGGQVRLEDRYHFCIPDWLDNPWPARDVTASVARKSAAWVSRRIDRRGFLASRGGDPNMGPEKPEPVRTEYLPRDRVRDCLERLPDGTIALFVVDRPGLVVGHVGFLFRQKGRVVLRHASETRARVLDEPLTAYLRRAPRSVIGLKVLQPDLARLQP